MNNISPVEYLTAGRVKEDGKKKVGGGGEFSNMELSGID